jgi:RNA polymerase sigma factor (sigma-70 family)
MDSLQTCDDRALLHRARRDPAAFAAFYARHERRLLGYLVRRTGSGEVAADVCAEVFAAALHACRAGEPCPRVPVAWLFGVANHKLADSARDNRVDDRARRRLQMHAIELSRGQVSEIERLADEDQAACLLDGLPDEQRTAVLAHVIQERAYRDIARDLSCSESVVRQRVSRGLRALRLRLKESA